MKTGILFDLDGTLMDTLEDLLDATNYALREFGFPPRTLPELRRFVGNGARNQMRLSAPEGTEEETVSQVLAVYKPYYTAHCQIKTRPYQGIPEALTLLCRQYPVAIVSNKPHPAVVKLAADYFDALVENAVGEKPGIPRKPARDMIVNAMAELSASPESTVYVGDSEVDVKTAANAGIPCISVCWGFRDESELKQAGATCICHTMAELEAVLLG